MEKKDNIETFSRIDLENMIKDILQVNELNETIKRQILEMRLNYNMTYKEIGRCISYFCDNLGGKISPIYGISIVRNVREQADKYFKQLELDQLKRRAEAEKLVKYQDNNIIFNIKSLKHEKRKPKQIKVEGIKTEVEEDGKSK